MKRRNGHACSMVLDPDLASRQELKGDVYNIFPYIYDPKGRAFTLLGIIDAIFYPITHRDKLDRISSIVNHEGGHFILSSAMVTCEERALAAQLLGTVWQFLIVADDDVRLLIPSFTIRGPGRKVFELKKLVERLEKLFDAREAVHEIVARAMQVGGKYWDRDKAKRLIREVIDNNLLDEKALDGFLEVFENFGPMGACSVGHYALNAVSLTKRSALARFKRATKVACAFKPKARQNTPFNRLVGYLEFVQHLDSNLPGYNMAHCPPAGTCLPSVLDSWADSSISRGEQAAAAVYRRSAFSMRESRCHREEQVTQDNNGEYKYTEMLPDSVQEILRSFDPEAAFAMGYPLSWFDPVAYGDQELIRQLNPRTLTPLALIEHDSGDYKYTIGINREEKDRPLVEISLPLFSLFTLEGSLQQMMCGEGPLCLCYPHQPANCIYRPLLQRMWDCTEPDPKWENNWKQPKKKPRCIE